MNKCTKCGAEILEGENFCKECGTPVSGASPQIDPFNIGINSASNTNVNQNNTQDVQMQTTSASSDNQKPVFEIPNPVLQTESGQVKNAQTAPTNAESNLSMQNAAGTGQLSNNQESMHENIVTPGNTNVNEIDMELIDAYIGKNATGIKNKSFSWCTFLFSYIYLFYRKMWLYGVIVFLLSGAIPFLIFPYGILIVFIGIIVFAFKKKNYT